MKKVMFLGGTTAQMTAVRAAKRLGYYVITVDYLPGNPAHKYADEYHNISTIEKEKVLELAKELQIDGIVSYASDVSAPTAAFVAEQMHLPTNPYESVVIMTRKDLFRQFLRANGFPTPEGNSFSDYEEAKEYFIKKKGTVIVKPVDSSGSKGVNKVTSIEEFTSAWDEAISYSISHRVIVEEYIERSGYQIDGDIFVADGKIKFWGICDQHHDFECSPYTPSGLSFPSTQSEEIQEKARGYIEKILILLNMSMGGYNVEYIVDKSGEVYILEIGPRSGGNLIPDTIYYSTGFDMAGYVVKQAAGDDVSDAKQMECTQCCSSYVIHSQKDGIFKDVQLSNEISENILKMELETIPKQEVKTFKNAKFGMGLMVIKFDSVQNMCKTVDNMSKYINVILEQ